MLAYIPHALVRYEGRPLRRIAIAFWGVAGVAAMLLEAEVRLARLAVEGLRESGPLELGVAAVWSLANAYLEGYRGFQKRFVPMALDRAFALSGPIDALLAPLIVLGLVRTEAKACRRAWFMIAGISLLVFAVRHLDQPWRGVVDAGVVVGLGWGLLALVGGFFTRLRSLPRTSSPGT